METPQQHDSPEQTWDGDYVEFFCAGTRVKGVFKCVSCQGVVVASDYLGRCRACGERIWERADWSPFHRAPRTLGG
jgi:hypothetical protein